MKTLILPKDYKTELDIMETEIAIKGVKDFFQKALAQQLNLTRVSAPLFVDPMTGLNDNLNGVERVVDFTIKDLDEKRVEIVQSLAKWKRMALGKYGFESGAGLYTDMNAIRRDEDLDNLHSIYVDQWDWEKVIDRKDRNIDYLKDTVDKIYTALRELEADVCSKYSSIKPVLPKEIFFITTQDLEDKYPDLSGKEREDAISKEKKAVFIMKIGGLLESGVKHDGRAPDYDDWTLNGDIILWNEILGKSFEVSSMGVRVDEVALAKQLEEADAIDRSELEFHKSILEQKLPLTIGGGIGQSRICMYFLQKAHVGEVQVSIWPQEMIDVCKECNMILL